MVTASYYIVVSTKNEGYTFPAWTLGEGIRILWQQVNICTNRLRNGDEDYEEFDIILSPAEELSKTIIRFEGSFTDNRNNNLLI